MNYPSFVAVDAVTGLRTVTRTAVEQHEQNYNYDARADQVARFSTGGIGEHFNLRPGCAATMRSSRTMAPPTTPRRQRLVTARRCGVKPVPNVSLFADFTRSFQSKPEPEPEPTIDEARSILKRASSTKRASRPNCSVAG